VVPATRGVTATREVTVSRHLWAPWVGSSDSAGPSRWGATVGATADESGSFRQRSAEELLAERLARGEIDEAEYTRLRDIVRSR
jgi:putative oligomerization/nucleic acid binding protein